MFSNSNAYLGGNSQRPGQQQYGSQFGMGTGAGQQGLGQSQAGPFAPQPTGFGQAPLQQQFTGYPMASQATGMPQQQQPPMPLQSQFTGMPGPQGFQAAPPMPSIPPQYQQQFQLQQQQLQQQQQPQSQAQPQAPQFQISQPTGFASPSQLNPLAPPPPPQKPQPTGFTEMAASFQTGASKPAPAPPRKTNKIPNIRLSFITAQDQAKFETLFKSKVGDSQTTISGDKARDLLLRSRLDGDTLSHIW